MSSVLLAPRSSTVLWTGDVVILGATWSGLAAAQACAARGWRTCLLEQGPALGVETAAWWRTDLPAGECFAQARALARLVKRVPSKVNLIPLNESAEWLPGLSRPSREGVDAFGGLLASSGVDVTVRWSKGLGAAAACGQLKGRETPGRLLRVPPPSVRS